jgi:O-antigen/teichoic acid export membrane protein
MSTASPSTVPSQAAVQGLSSRFLFQGLATFSTYLVSLGLMPLILKTAGASVYGSFVLWTSLLNLGLTLLTMGAGFQARRSLPSLDQPVDRQNAFVATASFQLLVYGFASVVLVGLAPWVQHALFRDDEAPRAGIIVAMVSAFFLNNLSDDYFRYTHRIKIISIVGVVRSVGYAALVILHVVLGGRLSVNSLLLCQAISYGVCGAWMWGRIARESRRLRFRLSALRYYLDDIRYGFPLIAAVLVENLLAVSDRYILGGCLSLADVGVYASAGAVGTLLLIIPKVATGILSPAMASAVDAGRHAEAEGMLRQSLQFFVIVGFPFIIGGGLLAQPILTLLATPEIAVIGRWVVPLTATATFLYGYSYLMFNALFVERRTGLWFKANSVAAAVSIVLNLLFIAWFRRIEIAAAVAVFSYGVCALLILLSSGQWRVHPPLKLFTQCAIACLGMALSLLALRELAFFAAAGVLPVLLQVALGSGVYFAVLAALGGWNPAQLRRTLGL